MDFPNLLTITTVDSGTGQPVRDVALLLWLFPMRKNNYAVGPKITNEEGIACFSRSDCEHAISAAQNMFLMDYSGDLADCRPIAKIVTHRPEHIEQMLKNYRESPDFWGSAFTEPEKLFRALESVVNHEYEPVELLVSEEQILRNPSVRLELRRRSSAAHS